MAQYRIQLDNLGWRGKLAVAAAITVGLAAAFSLVILSVGLAIVLLPVVAVGLVIGRWRLNKMMEEARKARAASTPKTIEIDYRVVDGERR